MLFLRLGSIEKKQAHGIFAYENIVLQALILEKKTALITVKIDLFLHICDQSETSLGENSAISINLLQ